MVVVGSCVALGSHCQSFIGGFIQVDQFQSFWDGLADLAQTMLLLQVPAVEQVAANYNYTGGNRHEYAFKLAMQSRDGTVVKPVSALAFHHCGPGSKPGPDVTRCVDLGIGSCPFSESFSPSFLVFVQPQKPAPQILISILMYMDTHIHHHGDLFLYGVKNSLTDCPYGSLLKSLFCVTVYFFPPFLLQINLKYIYI